MSSWIKSTPSPFSSSAPLSGAFFGLVTYAARDLTNLAVLEGFPASIVAIDLAWGTFLASSLSLVTYAVVALLPGRKPPQG